MAERTIQVLDHNGPATWMERRQVSVPWCAEHDQNMVGDGTTCSGWPYSIQQNECRLESPVQHWVNADG